MALARGTLVVNVVEARNLARADFLSKNDPYCRVRVSGCPNVLQTKTIRQGRNPRWNQELRFPIENVVLSSVKVAAEVWDQDEGRDDFIGSVEFHLHDVRVDVASVSSHWHQIRSRTAKLSGEVLLEITFRSSNAGVPGTGMHPTPVQGSAGYGGAYPGSYSAPPSGYPAPSSFGAPSAYGQPPAGYYSPTTGYPGSSGPPPPAVYQPSGPGYPGHPPSGTPHYPQQPQHGHAPATNYAPPPGGYGQPPPPTGYGQPFDGPTQ
uniref:C2 domain-containing protein n=1 Tax=Compsopogon caeruleus TaxID=31354 RepID=A0A7S1TJ43_9RHOD|mmetsp:Transcript_9056/g.18315  ORF Transcript_9056/g.18315 Transcript_9056/m.18315 type:complete len:263 (+) Transcript_9056:286-1074(+)